jgi:phosphatidylglycerol:prolipoprotein diacylglycerol transferase
MHPILTTLPGWVPLIGGAAVYSYGSMLGLSFAFGWLIVLTLAARDGISPTSTRRILTAALVGAIVGARLLFVIANPWSLHGPLDIFRLQRGGLVAYGGILGGILSALLACRRNHVSFWVFADHAAPTLALGLVFTRIGCFLNGCCFGRISDSWFSVRFPAGSPAFLHHLRMGLLDTAAPLSLPVLPVQLVASLNGMVGLLLLAWVYRRRRTAGEVLLTFVIWYGATRFLLELLRDDPQRGTILSLSTSQFVGGVAAFCALVLLSVRRARRAAAA